MKKIFFGKRDSDGHVPFWQPWGFLGCLGRLLLFLLMLSLLIALLYMFRSCNSGGGLDGRDLPSEFDRPGDEYVDPIAQNRPDDTPSDPSWNQPIPGAEDVGLPAPNENQLPPFGDMTPIPNPENGGATQVYPNLLYVVFDSDANDETFKTFARKFTQLYPPPENEITAYNTGSKTAVLTVPEDKRMTICQNLPSQISEVSFYVVPVEVMTNYEAVRPNDPVFRYPDLAWYFEPIQAYEAWGITQGSEDVVVGIVDSYMDLSHEELSGDRAVMPYSVITGGSNVAPYNGCEMTSAGHGSVVTSVAVGTANNGKGSTGIAPKCKYIPVSMGDQLNTITMVEGLLYCIYHGADVVNISCGVQFSDAVSHMPIDQQIAISEQYGIAQEKMWDFVFHLADERNVTVVWASGNENIFTALDISKRNPNTIRVSAVDKAIHKADFSNFGNFSDRNVFESTISAPGVDIMGATPNNTYVCWPGTSFSAPIITGTVALMKSLNANLTNEQIITILQETGKPVAGAPEIGKLVQIKDALMRVKATIADFDNNPNNLIGTWETTVPQRIYTNDVYSGEKGAIRIKFLSNSSAQVIFFKPNNKAYTAPATVSATNNKIVVQQTQRAVAPQASDYFVLHTFTLTPDSDGKMQCHIVPENSGIVQDCYLRRID